jgi:hypothetical protein
MILMELSNNLTREVATMEQFADLITDWGRESVIAAVEGAVESEVVSYCRRYNRQWYRLPLKNIKDGELRDRYEGFEVLCD